MPDPLPIKRPATLQALSAEIAAAASAGTQVRLAGSASLPLTLFNPTRPIQTISTLRMNKLLEHAVADMTAIVDAGISLEALQKELAWRDQWLPIDPPVITRQAPGLHALGAPGSRTIGGLIATNSLGPLRFSSGDWRLLIMGMTCVDAAGTITKGGGRTVKNVAGYSTPRLMIGSCGSLAAIAQVTLRTFARPADERCILFYCDGPAQAEALLAAILVSPTTPAYLQFIGGMAFGSNPLQLPAGADGGMIVAAGFLGRTEVCQAQVEIIRNLPAARNIEAITQTAAQGGRLRLWMTIEPAVENAGAGFRMIVKSSAVADTITQLETAARRAGSRAWLVSEAANGIIRGMLSGATAAPAIRQIATSTGATLIWTQPPATDPSREPLYTTLKRELDPHSLFGNVPA